jgi:hypothetical protein
LRIWDGKFTISGGWDDIEGDGSAKKSYLISNANELAWISLNSQKKSFENTYFELTEDLRLNEYDINGITNNLEQSTLIDEYNIVFDPDATNYWNPIGSAENPFSGHFNGNGHTIYGLLIKNEKSDYLGLFGLCSENSSIENINIEAATIESNGKYIGTIAGESKGIINKCNVHSAFVYGKCYVGGIVGKSHVIVNSYSYSWLNTEWFDDSISVNNENSYFGGLTGCGDYVINCCATTQMESSGQIWGGIAGEITCDAYNCIALGVCDLSCYSFNNYYKNDSRLFTGDVFGVFKGYSDNHYDHRNLFYDSKNEFWVFDNSKNKFFELFKEKYPDINYKEFGSNYMKVINHEWNEKTGLYNDLSVELPLNNEGLRMLNDNIVDISQYASGDILNILKNYGQNGNYMELVHWLHNDGSHDGSYHISYSFYQTTFAPCLETTDVAMKSWYN